VGPALPQFLLALSGHSEDLDQLFQVNFWKKFEPLFATINCSCRSLAYQCWLLTVPHRPWAIAMVNYPCYLLLLWLPDITKKKGLS
jgi:hypothetical protein